MPIVFIPAQLKSLTGGVSQVEMEADNVRQVIEQLEAQFPGIRDRLCDGDQLAPTLQVSVDSSMGARGLRTPVAKAREVHFLPVIGGG
jgi:molybdopterin synthase sulfur carrier subunit